MGRFENRFFPVLLLALIALAAPPGYAVDEGESARDAELGKAREELQQARRELHKARTNLALVMEDQGSGYSQRGFLGIILMPDKAFGIKVIRTLADAPAERADVRAGDIVRAINGVSLLPTDLPIDRPIDADGGRGGDGHKNAARDSQGVLTPADAEALLHNAYQLLEKVKPGEEIVLSLQRGAQQIERRIVAESRKLELFCERGTGCDSIMHERPRTERGRPYIPRDIGAELAMIIPELEANIENAIRSLPFLETRREPTTALPETLINGLELAELNPGLGQYFGVNRGVLVVNIREQSIPGLRPGDVILSCGEREVTSPRQVMHILMSYEKGEKVSMTVQRNKRKKIITANMPTE